MAHFAEIENGLVMRVLVAPNEQEHRGQEYLSNDLGLGGTWIQCSYNNSIRKQYPGIGYTYNQAADVFVKPKPFPSWTLDENHDWNPPTPKPDGAYVWDEDTLSWVSF